MKVSSVISSAIGFIVKVVVISFIVVFVYRHALEAYDFGVRIFAEPAVSSGSGSEITVAIVEGKTSMQIGEILEEKGLIRDARIFFVQELLSEYHGYMKPGVYELNTAMTIEEMLAAMADLDAMEADEAAD